MRGSTVTGVISRRSFLQSSLALAAAAPDATVAKPWPQLSTMGFTVSAPEHSAPLLIRGNAASQKVLASLRA